MINIDNNGNYYPSIYTRNITNSPFHLEQVLETIRSGRTRRAPISTYFDKDLLDISLYNPWKHAIENRILPLINYRATLPADSAATSPNHEIVFVYDIEEITTISDPHRRELAFLVDHIDSIKLYYVVEYVLYILMFRDRLELLSDIVGNIEDVFNGQTEEMKQVVERYNALKNMYNEVSNNFDRKKSIISEDLLERCTVDEERKVLIRQIAKELQKIYNQRWKTVDKCLKLVNKRSEKSTKKYTNVVLSELGVVYGASQLLVSGHGSMVPIENIYSTKNVSKAAVFERIQKRFGEKCTLIYITSFPGRASIPAKLNIPTWHVTSNDSIRKLYKAQRDILLR